MTVSSRKAVAAAILLAALAVQTALATKARALEPIPGSITFQGQPTTKLVKSPIGSTFSHRFYADGHITRKPTRLGKTGRWSSYAVSN